MGKLELRTISKDILQYRKQNDNIYIFLSLISRYLVKLLFFFGAMFTVLMLLCMVQSILKIRYLLLTSTPTKYILK